MMNFQSHVCLLHVKCVKHTLIIIIMDIAIKKYTQGHFCIIVTEMDQILLVSEGKQIEVIMSDVYKLKL